MNTQPVELARIDSATTNLSAQMPQYVTSANDLVIVTREDFNAGAAMLRTVKDHQKRFEAERVKATGPLNEALRTVNGWFKGVLETLTTAETTLKRKLARYESDEAERARVEQAKLDERARLEREELERRAQAQAKKGNTERAAEMQVRAQEITPARADIAPVKAKGMGFGEHWEFVIEDASLIPREFLEPDLIKLGQHCRAMKNASAAPPGVRYQTRPKVTSRGW